MNIGLIITAISTFFVAIATFASWRSANASRATLQAQLLSEFMKEYSEAQMCKDLRALRNWRYKYGDKFAEEYINRAKKGEERALEIDFARRHVKFYFSRSLLIYNAKIMNKKTLKEIGAVDAINILYDIIEPLEKALNAKYDKRKFIQLKKIIPPRIVDEIQIIPDSPTKE